MNLRAITRTATAAAEAVADTVTGWVIPDDATTILQSMQAAPKYYPLGTVKVLPPERIGDLEQQVEADRLAMEIERQLTGRGIPPESEIYRRYELNRARLEGRRSNRRYIANYRLDMQRQQILAEEARAELKQVEAAEKKATGDAAAELYNKSIGLKATIEGAKCNHELAKRELEKAEAYKKYSGDLD